MSAPPARGDGSAGLFAADSALRRVTGEGLLLLGGGRALLMQIAHPLVARGVAEHSVFGTDRRGRFLRTVRPMYAIAFGSEAQAREAVAHVRGRHAGVVGAGYRAEDPELLCWVLATLVDSSLVVHERFVAPLPAAEQERYYADMRAVGELLGARPEALPPDLGALRAYVDGMVATLEVTETAREIAHALFAPQPLYPAPALLLARELSVGLLPPRLREGFGMPWGRRREAALAAAAATSRAVVPRLPRRLRRPPCFVMPPSSSRRAAGAAPPR